jgi:TPR repeat protein
MCRDAGLKEIMLLRNTLIILLLATLTAHAQGIDPDVLSGAEKGDADSQHKAGLYYNRHKNYSFAFTWFQKSAEQEYAPAQNDLGTLYRYGRGVAQDYVKAAELYMKAAEQGDANGEFNMAVMYDKGYGIPADSGKAFEFFQRAALKGVAEAQYNLATMYDAGTVVPKDLKKAFEWYMKAAAQGYSTAQYNVGVMFSRGEGVEKNFSEAADWFKKAASKGDSAAQSSLGALYFNGELAGGKDRMTGCAWIYLSGNIDNIYICDQTLKKEDKDKALRLMRQLSKDYPSR